MESLEAISPDGRRIPLCVWPTAAPRAVVQLLHGLAEHIGRYDRFADACNRHGFAVVGHNHRGHGAQDGNGQLGHYADHDGWSRVIDDAYAVYRAIDRRYPSTPILLFGHSMGSYIAQSLVMRKAPAIRALILSGSTWPNRLEIKLARGLAFIACTLRGRRRLSTLFDKLLFKGYNETFAPNRTSFDWLSRDGDEVDRYVADPLCGGLSSNALWAELFGGLIEISSPAMLGKVPHQLPLLVTGGEADPVGGKKALHRLAAEYEATNHPDVSLMLYTDARHEMLNELNRDAVTSDWLAWIDEVLAREP